MIVLSPSKTMKKIKVDFKMKNPLFLSKTKYLLKEISNLNPDEIKKRMGVSEKLAKETFDKYNNFSFENNLSPAILTYTGLQYRYADLDTKYDEFTAENVKILSAFYGLLRAYDGIDEYRLDFKIKGINLYEFWGEEIKRELKGHRIINLASNEYSKIFHSQELDILDIEFKSLKKGKLVSVATNSKIARGLMLKHLVDKKSESEENMKQFRGYGYEHSDLLSSDNKIIFVRKK